MEDHLIQWLIFRFGEGVYTNLTQVFKDIDKNDFKQANIDMFEIYNKTHSHDQTVSLNRCIAKSQGSQTTKSLPRGRNVYTKGLRKIFVVKTTILALYFKSS